MRNSLKHQKQPNGKVDERSPFFELIQKAYKVFDQAPPKDLGVCDCCMYPEIRKDFSNHKQNQLPLSYVNDWFFAAADDPLDKTIWRFLLPRILEVLASGEDPSTTALEISLSRFRTGDANNWSEKEWEVLDQFQRLFLSKFDLRPDEYLDDILCMFASAGWPTEELFSQILSLPTDVLVAKLWNDWCNFANPNIWITTFWDSSVKAREFYLSEKMQKKVLDFAFADDTSAELTEKAMSIADLMHTA